MAIQYTNRPVPIQQKTWEKITKTAERENLVPNKRAKAGPIQRKTILDDASGVSKDVYQQIRVSRKLRDEFAAVCKARDTSPSTVLREFMRDCVDDVQGKGK